MVERPKDITPKHEAWILGHSSEQSQQAEMLHSSSYRFNVNMAELDAHDSGIGTENRQIGGRKRRQPIEDVPSDLDAPERKRVLNILAQRRYRRRKKEQQASLEKTVAYMRNIEASSSQLTALPTDSPSSSSSGNTGGVEIPQPSVDGPWQASDWDISTGDFLDSTRFDQMVLLSSDSESSGSELQQEPQTMGHAHSANSDGAQWWRDVSIFLQQDEVSNTSFSDDFLLSVSELDLLRAACENAIRLKSVERLFDLTASTVFLDVDGLPPSDLSWTSDLPQNLQPTSLQLTVPHHPVVDILPWPSVRNKLINMYTMPEAAWPKHPEDREPCTLVRMIYDMESGGMRVWGSDPTSEDGWEVEQSFVDAWWWALDQAVIRAANRRRKARGQQVLTIGAPTAT